MRVRLLLKNRPARNPKKLNRSPNQIVVQKKKTNAYEEPKFRTADHGLPERKETVVQGWLYGNVY